MYCQDCNTGNTVDSKYCKECGVKINSGYRTMMLSIQDLPQNQSDEVVEQLTRLLDMAFWHNQAGNTEAAKTASEAALALNPNSTTAHSLLGTLYEKTGDNAKAVRHFESVLALNPESQADAAKLDQLRRGIHVRAVAPPIAHQWLPPAMLKLGPSLQQKLGALKTVPLSGAFTRVDPQRRPLYFAGAATALVAVGGLLLAHPWAQAETVRPYPVTAAAAPPPAAISRSAFAPEQAASVPPMVLLPSHANTSSPSYLPPVITQNDPFAGHVPAPSTSSGYSSAQTAPSGAGSPLWSLPPVTRPASVRRRAGESGLPPLRLAALPAVGGVAPATVLLPPGLEAAPDALPRHTVAVGSFNSASSNSVSSDRAAPPSDLSSHIRITVHQAPDPGAAGAFAPAAPSEASQSIGGGSGEAQQQRALSLQEAGAYSQAKAAYQSAIRLYETQIASGQNVETAQRGVAACQTGLQICLQSQP